MSENVTWQEGAVGRGEREDVIGGRGMTIWLTGLPASGKSTVADGVALEMANRGRAAYVLDGDNIRHGLNADLGFSAADRIENVRRIGEVASGKYIGKRRSSPWWGCVGGGVAVSRERRAGGMAV